MPSATKQDGPLPHAAVALPGWITGQTTLPGVRAWLWRGKQDMRIYDPDPRLWLHLHDGRVLVFRLSGAQRGDEHVIAALAQAVAEDGRGELVRFVLPTAAGDVQVQALYAAPVIPISRHKETPLASVLRHDVLAFLHTLDSEVLELLGRLESRAFYASVRNYNRLAALPAEQRTRRMQALLRFPALLVPMLLTAHPSANLLDGGREAQREAAPEVEQAIDHGHNLIDALARHYAVSRGLVRSPLCASFWDMDANERSVVLQLLDALPANKRPQCASEVVEVLPAVRAYVHLLHLERTLPQDDLLRQAHIGAFRRGWQVTWLTCQQLAPNLAHAVQDAGDFLAAVEAYAHEHAMLSSPMPRLSLRHAWVARHGLASVLRDSARWHRLRRNPQIPFSDVVLPDILGHWQEGGCHAQELLTQAALIEEGEAMHHCVADYWLKCVHGERIFSLTLPDGERATAEYAPSEHPYMADDVIYQLVQLRGACNQTASPAMQVWAETLALRLNQEALRPERTAAMRLVETLQPQATHNRVWLDAQSIRALEQTLEWLARANLATRVWLRAHVAGLAYYSGNTADFAPREGEPLQLTREPDNPHDPLAIRIDWRGRKIGYVPRTDNHTLAQAMDAGIPLTAQVLHLDAHASAWRRLEFGVVETCSTCGSAC